MNKMSKIHSVTVIKLQVHMQNSLPDKMLPSLSSANKNKTKCETVEYVLSKSGSRVVRKGKNMEIQTLK